MSARVRRLTWHSTSSRDTRCGDNLTETTTVFTVPPLLPGKKKPRGQKGPQGILVLRSALLLSTPMILHVGVLMRTAPRR